MKTIILLVAVIVLSACEETPEQHARLVASEAVRLCHDQLEEQRANRASYGMLTLMTGACHKLEDDYAKLSRR